MGDEIVHALIEKADWETLLRDCTRALARKPGNQLATGVLHQLFVCQLANVSNAELVRTCIQAAAVLERNYRAARQWDRLVELLQARIQNCEDVSARMELHLRLARVYETEMNDFTLAFGALARAFKEQPGRQDLRRDLERLADKGELFEELMGIFMDAAEGQKEDWAVSLRKRIARMAEHHFEDPEGAVRQWRILQDLRPKDSEVLDALQRLGANPETVSPEDFVEVSPPDLSESPEDDELPILERLYREHENYADLLEVLRLRARKEPNLERRKNLYYEVARLATEKLGRPEEAVQAYLDLLAGDMHNFSVIKRLNQLYLAIEPTG